MARLLFNNVTLTTTATNNQVTVPVGSGPVAFLIDYTRGSATNLEITIQLGMDKTTFYLPVDATGTDKSKVISAALVDGKYYFPVSLVGSATATYGHEPHGVSYMKILANVTGTATGNRLTLYMSSGYGQGSYLD